MPEKVNRVVRKVLGERAYTAQEREWLRLRRTERYQQVTTNVLGHEMIVADCASFLAMYTEIFERRIYKFRSDALEPYIIDCGANIGVSAIYFGTNYPTAKVVAFEADPRLVGILRRNLSNFGVGNVDVVHSAVWDQECTLRFVTEGADAGHAAGVQDIENVTHVPAVRLAPYLERRVDMLKMDIEGAELRVLRDCAPLLANVGSLFVEYHSFANDEQQLSELLALLRAAGFRVHVESVYGVIPRSPLFDPPSGSGSDLQLNVWAYRPELLYCHLPEATVA